MVPDISNIDLSTTTDTIQDVVLVGESEGLRVEKRLHYSLRNECRDNLVFASLSIKSKSEEWCFQESYDLFTGDVSNHGIWQHRSLERLSNADFFAQGGESGRNASCWAGWLNGQPWTCFIDDESHGKVWAQELM